MLTMAAAAGALSKDELVGRARLRHQLRLFERLTQEACAEADVTLPQYLLLLQVAGRPGRDWALIGELSECLLLRHHTTVELAGRCEAAGLVRRERDPQDGRKVRLVLTAGGALAVQRVARAHGEELARLRAHLDAAMQAPAARGGGGEPAG